jgi:hypothetical protein
MQTKCEYFEDKMTKLIYKRVNQSSITPLTGSLMGQKLTESPMSKFLVKSLFLAISLAFVPAAQAEVKRADLLRIRVTESTTPRSGSVVKDKKGEAKIVTEKATEYRPFSEGDTLFVMPKPVKLKGKSGTWYQIVEIERHDSSGLEGLYDFLTMTRLTLKNEILEESARQGVSFYIKDEYVVAANASQDRR